MNGWQAARITVGVLILFVIVPLLIWAAMGGGGPR